MPPQSVHLATLGCRLNEAELEAWAGQFRRRGLRLTSEPDQADLVVLNTCAVTAEASRKSRQWMRRLRRANPDAKLVLSGCYATLKEDPEADRVADLVVDNRDKDRLVDIAADALGLPDAADPAPGHSEQALFERNRHRAFVKVQDGCRYRCAFCIVTLARGEERSRPIQAVVEQVRRLHSAGVSEIVLTGVHLGGYGSDRAERLADLVAALLTDTEIARIRLGSLEPWELDDALLDAFSDPRLLPHLHLPLQSGADSVLRRMARRGRSRDFADLLERLRARVSDVHVSTDLIVGFPGETDAEFRQSLDFVQAMQLGHIHAFSYSPRGGTRAAALPDPIEPKLRQARMQALRTVADSLYRHLLQRQLGREFEVLLERPVETGDGRVRINGYTPNWLRTLVEMPAQAAVGGGRILRLRMDSIAADGTSLLASPVGAGPTRNAEAI